MKRRELYSKIWADCQGILRSGQHVAIVGGGISGLHLAWFLSRQQLRVTIFEPKKTGSLRIPLMHACYTLQKRPPLWEEAATYSRAWYGKLARDNQCILPRENTWGEYFVVRTRPYLSYLQGTLEARGVTIERRIAAEPKGFDLVVVAAGSDAHRHFPGLLRSAAYQIHGQESYFSAMGNSPRFTAAQEKRHAVTTNFMAFSSRAGLIHRNDESRAEARDLARQIFPGRRSALFEGVRLAAADRNPIVGFFPPPEITSYDALKVKFQKENYAALASRDQSYFFFTAMGYHAMTYAPYLAESVARWLTGGEAQNMICTLTPARFLPRN